jgi:tetratricopeptide (TPR) repeat protein
VLLQSPIRKAALAVLTLGLCAAYLHVAERDWRASRLARFGTRESLEEASRLEPGNATYADLLGRRSFYADQDVKGAVREFESATSLNPGMAQYWTDLALAYSAAGQTGHEREAVQRALLADPSSPEVAWDTANFYFALGDSQAALAQLHIVFQYQSWSALDAMQLAWRGTHDPAVILREAIPDDPETRLTFLKFLLSQNEPEAAAQVWNQVTAEGRPFDPKLAFPYVQYMLAQKQVAGAQEIWKQLAAVNPGFAPYLPYPGMMVNSGFEQDILNAGFDWRYQQVPHVSLALDASEARGGKRALAINFDGGPVGDLGFWQLVPVQPGTTYEMTAYSQAAEWSGTGGLRLAVEDAFDHTPCGASELLATTAGWRASALTFTTGPQTTLVMVKLVRDPAGGVLAGKFWLDDVSLLPHR